MNFGRMDRDPGAQASGFMLLCAPRTVTEGQRSLRAA
jgi:hypothetical protein